jgi:hypothetical protein
MLRLLATMFALLSLRTLTEPSPTDVPELDPFDDDEIDDRFDGLERGDDEDGEDDESEEESQ